MFKLRYIKNFKFFKFFGPVYKCYKVHEVHDDETYIFCYRWDYGRWEWISEKDLRPVFRFDLILQILVIVGIAILIGIL